MLVVSHLINFLIVIPLVMYYNKVMFLYMCLFIYVYFLHRTLVQIEDGWTSYAYLLQEARDTAALC